MKRRLLQLAAFLLFVACFTPSLVGRLLAFDLAHTGTTSIDLRYYNGEFGIIYIHNRWPFYDAPPGWHFQRRHPRDSWDRDFLGFFTSQTRQRLVICTRFEHDWSYLGSSIFFLTIPTCILTCALLWMSLEPKRPRPDETHDRFQCRRKFSLLLYLGLCILIPSILALAALYLLDGVIENKLVDATLYGLFWTSIGIPAPFLARRKNAFRGFPIALFNLI